MSDEPIVWAELTSEPIGRMELAYMAVGMRDPNLVHIDDDYAARSGFPSVIAHGTFAWGYFGEVAASRHGSASVAELSISLRAPVLLGQRLTVRATVDDNESDAATTRLALQATVDDGTVVATGHALVDASRAAA